MVANVDPYYQFDAFRRAIKNPKTVVKAPIRVSITVHLRVGVRFLPLAGQEEGREGNFHECRRGHQGHS